MNVLQLTLYLSEYVAKLTSFISDVVSNLMADGLIALSLVYIFRVPKFELHLDYIPAKKAPRGYTKPVLDISVRNKKKWLGFEENKVHFGLFIPTQFIENKQLYQITSRGKEYWSVETGGKNIFKIDGETYYQYRGIILRPLYPDSRDQFLRIEGKFEKNTTIKIYYYFNTPYGRYPTSLNFGEIVKSAENNKLPLVEVEIP